MSTYLLHWFKIMHHYYHNCCSDTSNYFKYCKCLNGNIDKIIMAAILAIVALIQNLPTIVVEIVKQCPDYWRHCQSIYKLHGFNRDRGWQHCKKKGYGRVSNLLLLRLWNKVSGYRYSWDLDSAFKDFFGIKYHHRNRWGGLVKCL